MKYIITESHYNKLISKITGKKGAESFISKIKNFISSDKDQFIGIMILESVKEGNYELESIDQKSANFTINSFPVEIKRNPLRLGDPQSFNKNKYYTLILPVVNSEPLEVSVRICRDVFYTIASKHMDPSDYLKLWGEDNFDGI
jgi:hypothetical protein